MQVEPQPVATVGHRAAMTVLFEDASANGRRNGMCQARRGVWLREVEVLGVALWASEVGRIGPVRVSFRSPGSGAASRGTAAARTSASAALIATVKRTRAGPGSAWGSGEVAPEAMTLACPRSVYRRER